MSLTLSPAVKVFALLGVIAMLVIGAGLFVLGNSQDASLDDPIVLPKKQGGLVATPVAATKVAAKAWQAAKRPAAVAGAAKSGASAKAEAKAKTVAPKRAAAQVAANGLPTTLARALARQPVVVVALFGAGSKVDPLAVDEAEAGARAVGAGFVAIDVTRQMRAAEALTLQLGTVLRTPAVLVFTRPKTVAIHLDGYRDRETVAQAAHNALR